MFVDWTRKNLQKRIHFGIGALNQCFTCLPLFPGLSLLHTFYICFFSEVAQPKELSYQQFNLTSANEEWTTQKYNSSSTILSQQLTQDQHHPNIQNQHHPNVQDQHHPNVQDQHHPNVQDQHHPNVQDQHHSNVQDQHQTNVQYQHHPNVQDQHHPNVQDQHHPNVQDQHHPNAQYQHLPYVQDQHHPNVQDQGHPNMQDQHHSNEFIQCLQNQNTQNQHLNTFAQHLQHPNLHNQQHPKAFMQNLQHTNTQNQRHSYTENQQKSGFIYKNYKFHLMKRNKKHIYWRCANYRKTHCPAVFYTTLNFEPLFQKHQHISVCESVSFLDKRLSQQTFEGAKSSVTGLQSAIKRGALKYCKQQKPSCEPDISLDRTHSQQTSEGEKSVAGFAALFCQHLKSVTEPQSALDREGSQTDGDKEEFTTDSQILEREEEAFISTSQSMHEGKEKG